MKNFQQLKDSIEDSIWERFYQLFQFAPSTTVYPAIKTDKPYLRLDISKVFGDSRLIEKLERTAIELFIHISSPGERLYALVWQHQSYDFDPRQPLEKDEFDEWIIPILPNGDYYIFLESEFDNVWFGHPWEETITLVGSSMIQRWEEIGLKLPVLK